MKNISKRACNDNENKNFKNSNKQWIYDNAYVGGGAKVSY